MSGHVSEASIDQSFVDFHQANPTVYELLVKYARQAKAAGRAHFGVGMLWERLRWYVSVETHDPAGFKLNNNFRSRYARLLMSYERCAIDCPGCARPNCLVGLFETRHCPTEGEVFEELL